MQLGQTGGNISDQRNIKSRQICINGNKDQCKQRTGNFFGKFRDNIDHSDRQRRQPDRGHIGVRNSAGKFHDDVEKLLGAGQTHGRKHLDQDGDDGNAGHEARNDGVWDKIDRIPQPGPSESHLQGTRQEKCRQNDGHGSFKTAGPINGMHHDHGRNHGHRARGSADLGFGPTKNRGKNSQGNRPIHSRYRAETGLNAKSQCQRQCNDSSSQTASQVPSPTRNI